MRARHSLRHTKASQLQIYAAQNRVACTASEAQLWSALSGSKLGIAFRRQLVLGNFIVDFVAPRARLVVEVDGGYHAQRAAADARRDSKLRRLGYRVVRIPVVLVMNDLQGAVGLVRRALYSGAITRPLRRGGELHWAYFIAITLLVVADAAAAEWRYVAERDVMGVKLSQTELEKISYLRKDRRPSGPIPLLPYWDGSRWSVWLVQPDGTLCEMHPTDAARSDYVARSPALETDLFIPFVDFMWQRVVASEIRGAFDAIRGSFHSLATSVAKIDFVHGVGQTLGLAGADFVATEVDYVLILARRVFDHLHELISRIGATALS